MNAQRRFTLSMSLFCALAGAAHAQFFSIDYRGPNISTPGPLPKTAGDILTPAPPGPAYAPPALPLPMVAIPAGVAPFPGLGIATAPGCIGAPPGAPCPVEVDALSNGMDFIPVGPAPRAGTWVFSVDEFAVGFPGSALPPNVLSEAPCFDNAADVFEALNIPGGPMPPFPLPFPLPGNSGLLDGNGFITPCGGRYPGVGLFEPRPAIVGPGARPGDNLDALELDPPAAIGMWFSLDAGFIDPCFTTPNTGSAIANGFLPGAVLFSPPGGPPMMWYPPIVLGLDQFGPPGSDDLDALVLNEDGVLGLTPGDYVRFSVRRGSAVIGVPDSLFGVPIEPGDILMPPLIPGPGIPPAIFIPAERLGLATARTGTGFICVGGMQGDELDALDTRAVPATGLGYCFGDGFGTPCPCANSGGNGRGCANSIFPAGAVLTASGSASVGLDTVLLSASSMSGGISVYFQGTAQASLPLDDGLFCLAGGLVRVGTYGNVGGASSNPPALGVAISVKGGVPPAGATRFYQVVYRNAAPAFCPPATLNRTNGVAIVWTP